MKLIITFFCSFYLCFDAFAQPEPVDYEDYRNGLIAKRQGEYEQAIKYFSDFLEEHPEHPRAYYYRGSAYSNIGEYKKALADFEKLCALDPKDEEAFYAAGRAAYASNNLVKAEQYYTKTLILAPSHTYALNDRGMTYCYLKDFGKAVNDFKKAVMLDSTFAMAYNNIGAARYFNQDVEVPSRYDVEDAKKWFTKAIEADNTLFIAYFNRAAMNYFLEEYEQSLFDLQKAASLNPSEALVHFYKGMVYRKQKNYGAAISAFEQSIEMDATLKYAFEEIGNTYKDQKQYDSALEYYEKANHLDKQSGGEIYGGLMSYRKAVIYALQENENKMYEALATAEKAKVFKDQKIYQDFLSERAFQKFRLEKDFQKFAKAIQSIKKYNKFVNSELNWFRMSM